MMNSIMPMLSVRGIQSM